MWLLLFVCVLGVCLFVLFCLFVCFRGGWGGVGGILWRGEGDPRDTNWYGFNVLSLCIVPLGDRNEMAKLHRREVVILAKQLEDPLIMGDEHQQKIVLAKVCLWIFCTEIHYLM